MSAWDLNLQIPYQAPQLLAQGLSSLGAGIGEALQKRQEAAVEAEKLQYENVKNQTIMQNLAKAKLITPEQMLEFQSANPKQAKALAEGHAANVAFNAMQQRNTPVPPSVSYLPNALGQNPIQVFNPGGSPTAQSSIVPQAKPQVPAGIVGLPVSPELQKAGMPPTVPALQQPSGAVQPLTMPKAEEKIEIVPIKGPDGKTVNVIKGGGMTARVLDDKTAEQLKLTPEERAMGVSAHYIPLRQSNGSMQWVKDPSFFDETKPDTLASIANDALTLEKLSDAKGPDGHPILSEKLQSVSKDLIKKRLRTIGTEAGVFPKKEPTVETPRANAAVTAPNLPTTPVPPQVKSVSEVKNLPSDQPSFYDPYGTLRKNPNYKPQ